jgi:hypothetical protein
MSNVEPETTAVAIARIEATLVSIKNQIDYSERSSAQLVRMVDERFTSRFDVIDRRMNEMDTSRERARLDDVAARREYEKRLGAVERFNTRLVGICTGLAIGTSGITALIVKAVGS